ncbi:dihydropyrimidinase [Pseudohyphozyma bogoriensis]|nr:dihydropyrimidinase [Pseudohyphozyma bogoriensis]
MASSSTAATPAFQPPPEVEETIARLTSHKAVRGVLILARATGIIIRSAGPLFALPPAAAVAATPAPDASEAETPVAPTSSETARAYAKAAVKLVESVGTELSEVDQSDEARFLRIRTKKHELMITLAKMSFKFDLIIKNAVVVTASDEMACDIGCIGGKVAMLGLDLPVPEGCKIIDAEGRFVTIRSLKFGVSGPLPRINPLPRPRIFCVTLAESAGVGARSSDDWTTATRSALGGGTTTVVAFAVQHRGKSMLEAVADYHKLSGGNALADFAYHVIVTDPSEDAMHRELPQLVADGITSVKIYSTYPALKLTDLQILDLMYAARQYGVTVMIHAENSDMIEFMTRSLEKQGKTAPWHHGTSRPPIIESEATGRALALSELMDCPALFVHVSAPEAMKTIRDAQTRGMSIYGETCPHYVLLDASAMKGRGFEGAKACCAPPVRENPGDKEKIWEGVANGTFTVISSDHAPTNWGGNDGKQLGLIKHLKDDKLGNFRHIPNGLPGVETRSPLLWSEGVCKGRISRQRFVELNSTNAAKLYGLYPQKGTIAPGSDADFIVWRREDERKKVEVTVKNLHSACDYTPYEGMILEDWPLLTILRGEVVFSHTDASVLETLKPGGGNFIKRGKSTLQGPRNKWLSSWRPDYEEQVADE